MPPNGPHAHPEFEAISKRMDAIDGEHKKLHEDHETLREEHKRLASDPHAHPEFAEISKRLDTIDGEHTSFKDDLKKHVHTAYILEGKQKKRIVGTMTGRCGDKNRVQLSEPIRFDPGKPEPNLEAKSSPYCKEKSPYFGKDSPYKKTIEDFVNKWHEKATDWRVFSFRGPGEQAEENAEGNDALSQCRVEAVTKTMRSAISGQFKEEVVTEFNSEIALSQNVRIAVCAEPKEGPASDSEEPRLTAIQPNPLKK